MAEFATIARPYAKALFSLAQEKNQIESWLGELKELAAVVQDEKVIAFIEQPGNRELPKRQKRSKVLSVSKMSNWQILLPFWPSKSVCWYCRKFMPNIKI